MLKITDEGISYSGDSNEKPIPWAKLDGLFFPLFAKSPYLKIQGHGKIYLNQESAQREELIALLFQKWHAADPNKAKKNAFDYMEPRRSASIALLCVSLFFATFLAIVLLHDSYTQLQCSRLLVGNTLVTPATVIKAKKKKSGAYELELKFTGTDGIEHYGKRRTLKTFEIGNMSDSPGGVTVVYAESQSSCWMVSQKYNTKDINWAYRRYTTWFRFLTGVAFLLLGAFASYVSIRRIKEKRPAISALRKQFDYNL